MKLLLDTHTLLWLVSDDPQLSKRGCELLIDPGNDLLLSPATYWELAIKISIGKYRLSDPLAVYIDEAVQLYGLTILPIAPKHAEAIVLLQYHHRDPFDRMLIAQAIVEDVAIVSADKVLDCYPIKRFW